MSKSSKSNSIDSVGESGSDSSDQMKLDLADAPSFPPHNEDVEM